MRRVFGWLLLLLLPAAAALVPPPDPRGAIFIARGCAQCHAVSDFGVRGATDAGPDLAFAAEEAPIRYGVSLRTFLDQPTGVMEMVLATHLRLSAVDRDSIADLLERLDAERRTRARVVALPR